MDCNEYENLITDYLEDILSPAQREEMDAHLSECEVCRTLSIGERAIMGQLKTLPLESCPDDALSFSLRES